MSHLRHKIFLLVILFVVVGGGCLVLLVRAGGSGKEAEQESREVVFEGVLDCLPHKQTEGPVTQECALGLRVNNETYYGVSTNRFSSRGVIALPVGTAVRVRGKLEPIEKSGSGRLRAYDVKGVVKTSSLTAI